jgi:DNA polymerase-3 subunit epsilon
MPEDAFRVHGLSDAFLADKPRFAEIADEMMAFFGDAPLIAHNAPFDMGFLNHELRQVGQPPLGNKVIDTVMLARDKHPGARVSLDALCKHYGIDNSRRALHGALLDSEILAEVYLELIGGKQVSLALVADHQSAENGIGFERIPVRQRPDPIPSRLSAAEADAHSALVAKMGDSAIWAQYSEA